MQRKGEKYGLFKTDAGYCGEKDQDRNHRSHKGIWLYAACPDTGRGADGASRDLLQTSGGVSGSVKGDWVCQGAYGGLQDQRADRSGAGGCDSGG